MSFDELFDRRSQVGTRLKECIQNKGYTKVSFAGEVGISRPTLDRLLSGEIDNKRSFDKHMAKILAVLHMTAEELLSDPALEGSGQSLEYTDKISEDLRNGICGLFGTRLVSIILYGSVARGTHTEQSDVDVALIVKTNLTTEEEDRLSDFVVDLNLKYDRTFSVIDIGQEAFEKWGDISPFYRNVKKDGIVLWKAA